MTDDWRAAAAAWWASPAWHAYEAAYGDTPGDRTRLLAAADWSTRILDLSPEPLALLRGMRKGRRAEIKVAECAHVFDAGTKGWMMTEYSEVHRLAHPGARSLATYAQQAVWLDTGHGLIVICTSDVCQEIAAAFFITNGGWSYFASSAALVPDVMGAVVWRGMLELKSRGVRWLELGWCPRPGDSEKTVNVARFKAHFGGVDVPARLP